MSHGPVLAAAFLCGIVSVIYLAVLAVSPANAGSSVILLTVCADAFAAVVLADVYRRLP